MRMKPGLPQTQEKKIFLFLPLNVFLVTPFGMLFWTYKGSFFFSFKKKKTLCISFKHPLRKSDLNLANALAF